MRRSAEGSYWSYSVADENPQHGLGLFVLHRVPKRIYEDFVWPF